MKVESIEAKAARNSSSGLIKASLTATSLIGVSLIRAIRRIVVGTVLVSLLGLLLVTPAIAGTKAHPKVTGKTIDATMVWDGVTRTYEVFLPANLPANPAMLLMLHGTSYDVPPSSPISKLWGWQQVANVYGFILVQPASTYDPNSG